MLERVFDRKLEPNYDNEKRMGSHVAPNSEKAHHLKVYSRRKKESSKDGEN